MSDPVPALYVYQATLVRVLDGDTLALDIDLGFHTWLHASRGPQDTTDRTARLRRINAPELSTAAGLVARDALAAFLADKALTIQSTRLDKYGRYLVELWADGENASDWMLASGYAVPYS